MRFTEEPRSPTPPCIQRRAASVSSSPAIHPSRKLAAESNGAIITSTVAAQQIEQVEFRAPVIMMFSIGTQFPPSLTSFPTRARASTYKKRRRDCSLRRPSFNRHRRTPAVSADPTQSSSSNSIHHHQHQFCSATFMTVTASGTRSSGAISGYLLARRSARLFRLTMKRERILSTI